MTELALGRLAGLRLTARPSALWATVLLFAALTVVAAVWLLQPLPLALGLGLAGVGLHWAADLWHQLGHAWAARSTGHPMVGIRLWGPFSASLYPADEPALPAALHVRRALGGPAASGLLTLAAGAALVAL